MSRCIAAIAGVVVILAACGARTPRPLEEEGSIRGATGIAAGSRTRAADVEPGADASVLDAYAPEDAGAAAADATLAASRYPGRTDGCPPGMLRVEGDYCPVVVATCLERTPLASERCVRYEEPSRCAYPKRERLTFCMDRFEYPNREGEKPKTLVDFHDAARTCVAEGKRICTADEYNFACEGPDLHPYATGFVREPGKCNIDREFNAVATFRMARHDDCLNDPVCAKEMERLDRRYPIGEHLGCVSWSGVYDLNGNVNEWVRLPEQKNYPTRGGLKGGWWGPVRARCRPTHTTHNEDYWGYELGFRCCKDAEGFPTDITAVSWRPSQSTDR